MRLMALLFVAGMHAPYRYVQLAEPAKIGKDKIFLGAPPQKKVAHICAICCKAVNLITQLIYQFI
jgi:hypothetical protein